MLSNTLSIVGVFVLGFSILVCGMVWAEEWKQYGVDDSGNLFYYDAGSIIRPEKNIVRVWAKMVHSKENKKTLGKGLENLLYSKRLWEINCADKKIRRLSKVAYSDDGKILISDNTEEKWQSIRPKSLEEDLYKNVCR